MKKLITVLVAFFAISLIYAQVPQGISYQAIAFNTAGSPVVSSNVSVRITILDNSATGTEVYKETHTKTTNNKGLFNLNIGQGTPVTGTFSSINWSTNSKFLKVELDPAGGTNYTQTGTNQLMSVPFALVAGSANNIGGTSGSSLNEQIVQNQYTNFGFNDYDANKYYIFNSRLGTWSSQVYSSTSSPSNIISSKGNFIFNDYDANKYYAYSSNLGTWVGQTYSSTSSPSNIIIDSLLGNFSFNDYDANKYYIFNSRIGTWSSQVYSSTSSPSNIISSKGNFIFNDYDDNKYYAYSSITGIWVGQSYSSSSSPSNIIASNGSFIFNDYDANKFYVFSFKTGTWSSQSYSNTSSPSNIFFSDSN